MRIARSSRRAKRRLPRPRNCAPVCTRRAMSCAALPPNWPGSRAIQPAAPAILCIRTASSPPNPRTDHPPRHRRSRRSALSRKKSRKPRFACPVIDHRLFGTGPALHGSPPSSCAGRPAYAAAANLECSELAFQLVAYGEAAAAGEPSAAGDAIIPALGAASPPAAGLASAEAAGAELSGAVSALFGQAVTAKNIGITSRIRNLRIAASLLAGFPVKLTAPAARTSSRLTIGDVALRGILSSRVRPPGIQASRLAAAGCFSKADCQISFRVSQYEYRTCDRPRGIPEPPCPSLDSSAADCLRTNLGSMLERVRFGA